MRSLGWLLVAAAGGACAASFTLWRANIDLQEQLARCPHGQSDATPVLAAAPVARPLAGVSQRPSASAPAAAAIMAEPPASTPPASVVTAGGTNTFESALRAVQQEQSRVRVSPFAASAPSASRE